MLWSVVQELGIGIIDILQISATLLIPRDDLFSSAISDEHLWTFGPLSEYRSICLSKVAWGLSYDQYVSARIVCVDPRQ